MGTVRLYISVFALALFTAGCAALPPRDVFRNQMNSMLERDVDQIDSFEFGYRKNMISSAILVNDIIENTYVFKNKDGGNCLYAFDIEPKTRRILRWRIEGSDKPCYGAP